MTTERTFRLSDFDFYLPDGLIAQEPAKERDSSRLLVMRRDGPLEHRMFRDIVEYLREGDVLVFNDARVIPARVYFLRQSGARVEFILTGRLDDARWTAICNRTSRLKPGEILHAQRDETVTIRVLARGEDDFTIESSVPLDDGVLNAIGVMPLPPYIRRDYSALDRERYQTVYARERRRRGGSDGGPALLDGTPCGYRRAGCRVRLSHALRLVGTFQPVRHEDISLHRMHGERLYFPNPRPRS